jgi:hypothetical protein
MRSELERFFAFIKGRSPLEIEFYRQRAAHISIAVSVQVCAGMRNANTWSFSTAKSIGGPTC